MATNSNANAIPFIRNIKSIPQPSPYYAVDLGLPSGTLWANKNIGAETEEDTGYYFAWGGTTGYIDANTPAESGVQVLAPVSSFSKEWYEQFLPVSQKYNDTDGKTILDLEDDAAHVNMGDNWRMPTFDECKELCLNTDIYLVPTEGEEIQGTVQEQDGSIMINWASRAEGTLKGVKFYKKDDKQTYMFVPASGSASAGSVLNVGVVGYLWVSSLYSSDVQNAWLFDFNAFYGNISGNLRYFGFPVRGIIPGNKQESLVGNTGDILMYDKTNDKKIIIDGTLTTEELQTNYPADSYTPIGVVVIPTSHDVYGDGSCGVMSLKPMNCSTPSTGGTSEQRMYWGAGGTNISALPNLDKVPIVGSGSNIGNASSTVTGEESYAYLPSDKFSAVQCPHDTDAYYYNSSTYYQIPSPYLTDGSRNPAYYQTTSPSSSSNALADFDGVENTEKITTQRGTKDYNSWKPGRTSGADYPAASCCDMFHTEGTSQGDWYLPACGELGYIMPPFNKINDAIDKMRTAYGSSVGVELDTNYSYWSSTEYNSNGARIMDMNRGQVGSGYKDSVCCVRAFTRVK